MTKQSEAYGQFLPGQALNGKEVKRKVMTLIYIGNISIGISQVTINLHK